MFKESFNVVDLTHTIDENTVVWDNSCGFTATLTGDYQDGGFRGQKYTMRSCLGTHIDLPAHCFEKAPDCSTINIVNCIVPAVVIDVTHKAHEQYGVTPGDIQEFENKYGKIQDNSLVFIATGWSQRWSNPIAFRNEKNGIPRFPFITQEAAQVLLERAVVGIGVETFSPDPFNSDSPVHKLLLGSEKYIIENVTNLENMPTTGSYVISLPLKISGGVESPIRLVGLK